MKEPTTIYLESDFKKRMKKHVIDFDYGNMNSLVLEAIREKIKKDKELEKDAVRN